MTAAASSASTRRGRDVARLTFFGLYALQHRGQESAGIAVADDGQITVIKDLGLVSQVFNEQMLQSLSGQHAIGHVRYTTTGSSHWPNSQPCVRSRNGDVIALGAQRQPRQHHELRDELLAQGVKFSAPPTPRSSRRSSRTSPRATCSRALAHSRQQDPRRLLRGGHERRRGRRLPRPLRRASALPGRLRGPPGVQQRDVRPGHHRRQVRARDPAGRDRHRRQQARPAQRARRARGRAPGSLHLRVHLLRPAGQRHEAARPCTSCARTMGAAPARWRRRWRPTSSIPVPGHGHAGGDRLRRRPPASPTPRASSRTATCTARSSSPTTTCARSASA